MYYRNAFTKYNFGYLHCLVIHHLRINYISYLLIKLKKKKSECQVEHRPYQLKTPIGYINYRTRSPSVLLK
jgi:hypothetical protein